MCKDKIENARVEYSVTNEAVRHYDNFSWQVGSILIAGIIAYWGLIIGNNEINIFTFIITNIFILFLSSLWFLYTFHNRQIYLYKLHRIHELEKLLGMKQNIRFIKKRNYYKTDIKGHYLDKSIYLLINIGNVVIVYIIYAVKSFEIVNVILNCIIFVVPIMSIVFVSYKVKETKRRIKEFPPWA
jgi:hypothetical protein